MNQNQETNIPAVVGFTLAILSWLTCGILTIPAAVTCIVGMQGDRPKALAVSGLVISGVPLLGWLFVIIFWGGVIGLGAAAKQNAEIEAKQRLIEDRAQSIRDYELKLKQEQEQRVRDFKTPETPKPRPGMRFVPTVDNGN